MNGTRDAHASAAAFDFTSIIQKPASSSLVSVKGPSVKVRFDPENVTRVPFELGWSPSPAISTPAFAISSLNCPIAARSSLLGSAPASDSFDALTSIMKRIVMSPQDFLSGMSARRRGSRR